MCFTLYFFTGQVFLNVLWTRYPERIHGMTEPEFSQTLLAPDIE